MKHFLFFKFLVLGMILFLSFFIMIGCEQAVTTTTTTTSTTTTTTIAGLSQVSSDWDGNYANETVPSLTALVVKDGKIYGADGSTQLFPIPDNMTGGLTFTYKYSESESAAYYNNKKYYWYEKDSSGKISYKSDSSLGMPTVVYVKVSAITTTTTTTTTIAGLSQVSSNWNGNYANETVPSLTALVIKDGKIYGADGSTQLFPIPDNMTGGLTFTYTYSESESAAYYNNKKYYWYEKESSGKISYKSDSSLGLPTVIYVKYTIPNEHTENGIKYTKISGKDEYQVSSCSLTSGSIIILDKINGLPVTSIGDVAFSGCSGLTGSLTIPNSVTSIGNGAFQNCSGLKGTLTIPNSVTKIGEYAFSKCSSLIGTLTIPDSVISIGYSAFSNCSGLTNIIISNSVTSFYGSFAYCSSLTNITIPNSVTKIGQSAFFGCSGLTNIIIPNSVTSIGDHAFYNCSRLGDITVPNSVTSIEADAFENCSGLIDLYMYASNAPEASNIGIGSNTILHIKSTGTTGYDKAPWTSFKSIVKDL